MQMMAKQSSFTPIDQTKIKFFGIGALLLAAWAWTFWSTLDSMEVVWRGSETYMHCYFIPLISLWLIWPLRHAINPQSFGSLWGLLLFIPSFILWLVGFAADVNLIAHFGAILCLVSLLWCWLGDSNFKVLRFPLLYLLFTVPFGEEANAPLQFVTAEMAVWLLQMTGIPVLHEGLYITTPVASFEVAEACSGVRFMIVALALAFLFSHMHFQGWKKRALFIGSLVILSIIANSFRAFFLIFIGEKSGMTYGFGADHYYYGWAFFAIVIFLSFHIGAKFGDKNEEILHLAEQTNRVRVIPVAISVMLLVTINSALFTVWQPITPPEQPAELPAASNWQKIETNRLHPSYPYSLASSTFIGPEGLQYFTAQFAHRQSRGELISWSNKVFQQEDWSVKQQMHIEIANTPWTELSLVKRSGERLRLYYNYQVGTVITTDVRTVKLLQGLHFISAKNSRAILHHFNCVYDEENCRKSVENAATALISKR